MTLPASEDVWQRETPHVLAALVRRYGDLAACEDAVQEALIEATRQWPTTGIPESPRGWLLRVASRRLIDSRRQDAARLQREQRMALAERVDEPPDSGIAGEQPDASLEVLTLCCHPALSPESQVMLTLRSVIGLTTKQIAAVYLVPSATVGQRISRAKATIDAYDRRFPAPETPGERLPALLQVLYLTYTVGHNLPTGPYLLDATVTAEAIRLARLLHHAFPDESETAGLLALMLLSEARRAARTTPSGDLVRLAEQDRSRWDRLAINEGVDLIEHALPVGPVGAYQLQAAIAAVHAEASSWEQTDWPQIAELYAMLARVAPSPAVTLNQAVAIGETSGPEAALKLLEPLINDPRLRRNHRMHAIRAALLERAGDIAAALSAYRTASTLCASIPEQRFLNRQIMRLQADDAQVSPHTAVATCGRSARRRSP